MNERQLTAYTVVMMEEGETVGKCTVKRKTKQTAVMVGRQRSITKMTKYGCVKVVRK